MIHLIATKFHTNEIHIPNDATIFKRAVGSKSGWE